jgi:RimJ/RimL family protein N-acetyltransferase|tara:strand:+ start:463 stop:909 length:447 start_codon:yes stop_codon:yes gene_type:complete
LANRKLYLTQLICGHDEKMAAWAEENFPDCAPLCRPLSSIGILSSDNKIMGVAIFNNYRQNDIEITFITATPKWATPGNIRGILNYPFIQLGVKRMTAITKKSNKQARKFLIRLGFDLEGVHPYAAKDGSSSCTYGLYQKKAEKWLNG